MSGLRAHHYLTCYHLFNYLALQVLTCPSVMPHMGQGRALEGKSNMFKVLGIHCVGKTQSMSRSTGGGQYTHQVNNVTALQIMSAVNAFISVCGHCGDSSLLICITEP